MRVYCREEIIRTGTGGLFWLGKAEEQLPSLVKGRAGKIQFVYLDPPVCRLSAGKPKAVEKDMLPEADFLRLMKQVLVPVKKLLAGSGTLAVQLPAGSHARLRELLDETMGAQNFVNEIIWGYKPAGISRRSFSRAHDVILIYRKTNRQYINPDAVAGQRGAERTNHWRKVVDENGRTGYTSRIKGRTVFLYEGDKLPLNDVWDDIDRLPPPAERTGYPAEKPAALMERLIRAFTKEGDTVLDPFSGSGAFAFAAAKNKRGFIATDTAPLALHCLRKRLTALEENPSLLDDADASEKNVHLFFPAVRSRCAVDCELEKKNGRKQVLIRSVSLDGEILPLLSAVSGTRSGDVFIPACRAVSEKYPVRLPLPENRERVLQLTMKSGAYVYVTL